MTRGIPIKRQEEEKTLLMARYYMPGGDIATVLDRSRESAYRILRRYGISVQPNQRTPEQFQAAEDQFNATALLAEVPPSTTPEPEPEMPGLEAGDNWYRRVSNSFLARRGQHDGGSLPAGETRVSTEELVALRRRLEEIERMMS